MAIACSKDPPQALFIGALPGGTIFFAFWARPLFVQPVDAEILLWHGNSLQQGPDLDGVMFNT
jgi:hypothetical protein